VKAKSPRQVAEQLCFIPPRHSNRAHNMPIRLCSVFRVDSRRQSSATLGDRVLSVKPSHSQPPQPMTRATQPQNKAPANKSVPQTCLTAPVLGFCIDCVPPHRPRDPLVRLMIGSLLSRYASRHIALGQNACDGTRSAIARTELVR
jgi:hypothetical protein